jgi:PPOX class probable F420-dependent enzyme
MPLGGAVAALLFALGRRTFALVDGTLALVCEPFTLIGNPLALVGEQGTLVRKALEPLEDRLAPSLTDGLLPEPDSVLAGQPLTLRKHVLALCKDMLALLGDALALGRDALTLRRQLGQLFRRCVGRGGHITTLSQTSTAPSSVLPTGAWHLRSRPALAAVQMTDVEPLVERDTRSWKGKAMATQMIEPGRYLSITSFKRDGSAVATPVWCVPDGERLFALTDLHSAKVRRIRRNPRVLVAPCGPSGKLRAEPVEARAEVLTATEDLEHVQKLLLRRYKVSYRAVMLFYRLGRRLRGRSSVADGAALAIEVG